MTNESRQELMFKTLLSEDPTEYAAGLRMLFPHIPEENIQKVATDATKPYIQQQTMKYA